MYAEYNLSLSSSSQPTVPVNDKPEEPTTGAIVSDDRTADKAASALKVSPKCCLWRPPSYHTLRCLSNVRLLLTPHFDLWYRTTRKTRPRPPTISPTLPPVKLPPTKTRPMVRLPTRPPFLPRRRRPRRRRKSLRPRLLVLAQLARLATPSRTPSLMDPMSATERTRTLKHQRLAASGGSSFKKKRQTRLGAPHYLSLSRLLDSSQILLLSSTVHGQQ